MGTPANTVQGRVNQLLDDLNPFYDQPTLTDLMGGSSPLERYDTFRSISAEPAQPSVAGRIVLGAPQAPDIFTPEQKHVTGIWLEAGSIVTSLIGVYFGRKFSLLYGKGIIPLDRADCDPALAKCNDPLGWEDITPEAKKALLYGGGLLGSSIISPAFAHGASRSHKISLVPWVVTAIGTGIELASCIQVQEQTDSLIRSDNPYRDRTYDNIFETLTSTVCIVPVIEFGLHTAITVTDLLIEWRREEKQKQLAEE